MKRIAFLIASIGALLLVGCSSPSVAPLANENEFVGLWIGEVRELPSVAYTRWPADRRSDGTYSITFRNYLGEGTYYDNVETGTWHAHDGIYHTVTLTQHTLGHGSLRRVHFEESYRILTVTENSLSYQDVKSGIVFAVRRVAKGYVLPEK